MSLAAIICGVAALAIGSTCLIVWLEGRRPILPNDWSQGLFGDQPNVEGLSHIGTFTTGSERDHGKQ